MHRHMMEALAAGELRPLREWLAGLQVETEPLALLPQWDAPPPQDHPVSGRRPADNVESAAAEILTQWRKAETAPGGVPFLMLFVLVVVEAEWNISYRFEPLWGTLEAARRCLRERGARLDPADRLSGRAVAALMESMAARIHAENAMVAGRLDAQQAALDIAVGKAREAGGLARRAAGSLPELSRYLVARAAEIEACDSAIAHAVGGVRAFLATGAPLDEAIAQLEAAEAGYAVRTSNYLSELRAHRLALVALAMRGDDRWLRVDHGKIVYVYPFAVRGMPPSEVLQAVEAHGAGWELGGTVPVSVNRSLNLDDVWSGTDAFERRYGGALVELADVLVRGVDDRPLGRVRAEIRFSRLGNHYVRFAREITDTDPADLYAAMLQAAPEYGTARVAFRGGPPARWPRLSELARDLAEDVCERLSPSEDRDDARARASQGNFHVVVAVHAASTRRGPAGGERREVCTAAELRGAVGAQLMTNPITYTVGSVVEWGRYTDTGDLTTTIAGLTGEQIVRTSNTTVIVAPGMATFTQSVPGHVVEFVASLDGLFAGWSLELVDHYERVEAFRARVDTVTQEQHGSSQALRALARELDAERIRLNDFATSVRSTIALIRSPSLVSSSVVADVLRLVLDGSTFQQRVAELNSMIEEVAKDQLGSSIAHLARQRDEQETREEERRQGRQRAKLEVFLATIAAAGMSGVVQVLQAGFFQSRDAALWATGSVSAILLAGLVLGYFFWPRERR